ncbi:Cu(I)/Ag(I) efflux system membrane fusion protein [Aquimarina sp. MAR_2010_214]|uniref:efflux RND transporter periplasmic adaptor subunit n=1 Tax=Aquimarina sp. MAR_2010_214 TaxID=1250026 RepID=UPI000C6FD255|nr:efflux RND transporter periplasmic adaptor subunit [Aquimarina sp. MAR_2010_214]PKV51275.1 Cu(I)/Ag(I) efflux system membrane fusion protein [Aquimarina sp. MAR_2010_214]
MNKNIIYIGIAVLAGLLGGYFIFGSNNSTQHNQNNHQEEATTNQMWTCSMHPQIMQTEPGDCPICGMDLIPTETKTDGLSADQFKMTENAMALANIQTTRVGNLTGVDKDRIILSGKIMENEEANAVQASYFDGRIERLNVNYKGQEVRKGQRLATIYAPNLVAAQQELITAVSLKESQPILYKAVRNKLKLWKLSDNQINAIESSGKVQENFPVYATVSGTVSEVMSAEGDYVKQGQPILKVSNLSTVWAEFDVYENQIAQFKKGQQINITTTAYPDKKFDGTISFINPVLNAKTRTITIRTNLSNRDHLFKPGMFVTGSVASKNETTEQLVVPASAVLWTGERSVVYIKTNATEPIFEMREVLLGNATGNTYTILNGLNNGDEIVTNGTFTVDAAAQLQGKKSMMNKEGGKTMMGQDKNMEVSKSFQKDFLPAFIPYLQMKDAFVESDASQASIFAKETNEILKAIKTSDLKEVEKTHLSNSIKILDNIANNKELEKQRTYFVALNETIVALVSNFTELSTAIYVQKCPMANTNKGAIWISGEKEIRNPYFGDAMLTCGSVINTIK